MKSAEDAARKLDNLEMYLLSRCASSTHDFLKSGAPGNNKNYYSEECIARQSWDLLRRKGYSFLSLNTTKRDDLDLPHLATLFSHLLSQLPLATDITYFHFVIPALQVQELTRSCHISGTNLNPKNREQKHDRLWSPIPNRLLSTDNNGSIKLRPSKRQSDFSWAHFLPWFRQIWRFNLQNVEIGIYWKLHRPSSYISHPLLTPHPIYWLTV